MYMEIQHMKNTLAFPFQKKPRKNLEENDHVMCCPVLILPKSEEI